MWCAVFHSATVSTAQETSAFELRVERSASFILYVPSGRCSPYNVVASGMKQYKCGDCKKCFVRHRQFHMVSHNITPRYTNHQAAFPRFLSTTVHRPLTRGLQIHQATVLKFRCLSDTRLPSINTSHRHTRLTRHNAFCWVKFLHVITKPKRKRETNIVAFLICSPRLETFVQ